VREAVDPGACEKQVPSAIRATVTSTSETACNAWAAGIIYVIALVAESVVAIGVGLATDF
jgi:hypothetical protein